MEYIFELVPDAALKDTVARLSGNAQAEITRAGAYSLYVLVRRHVNRYARAHHASADRLQADRTGHLEDGSAAIVPPADNVLSIPIPGFQRVFKDLAISPRTATALTIPINRVAYGKRAARLQSEGWRLFTVSTRGGGPGGGILFGRRGEASAVTALYALSKSVRVRQDRSMLPTDEDMQRATAKGVARAILRRTA